MLSQAHVCASLMRSSDVNGAELRKTLTGLPPPSHLDDETNALADAHTTRLVAMVFAINRSRRSEDGAQGSSIT